MNTVEIPLSRGLVAVVDEADGDRVLAHKWYAATRRRTVYAARNLRHPDGRPGTQLLHTFITGYQLTDHVNGDGLDNRRANLREVVHGGNAHNIRRPKNNTSGFKGVSWNRQRGKWQVQIQAFGERRHIGLYESAIDAALAYDAAARQLHGEHSSLNFPNPGERAA